MTEEAEACGLPYLSAVSESDRPRIALLLDKAFEGEASDFEFQTPDSRVFSSCFAPLTNDEGNVQRVMGITQDITESRRADTQLRTMFEQAAVGVALVDSQSGVILQINRRYSAILGETIDALVGRTWMELTHPDDLSEDADQMDRLLSGEIREFSIEKRLRRADDTFAWINLTVSSMWQPGDAPSTHIAIVEDITSRKDADAEVLRQREMLAHVNRLSTMGELVAGIAHEVKQPLYAISNFTTAASVLLRGLNDSPPTNGEWLEELKEWNRGARDASQRASEIIARLRDFVRNRDADRQNVDVRRVVQDSIELVGFMARRYDASVEARIDDTLPDVFVARIQFEQVVVNLLQNAFESLADVDGNRHVFIRGRRNGQFVQIEIEDNGAGVEDGQRGKLFDAFYTTKASGLGMGLAISRTIVEDHGGRLWVGDGVGRGAVFHFTLPVANGRPCDEKTEIDASLARQASADPVADAPEDSVYHQAGEHE